MEGNKDKCENLTKIFVLIDFYKREDKSRFHRFEHSWVSPP